MGILGNLFRGCLYSVMNDDHAQMFKILAEIRKFVGGADPDDGNEAESRQHVEAMINRLVDASVVHFFREEALMKACHFPEAATHRMDHLFLIRSVQSFQARAFRDGRPITVETVRYLRDWVVNHINSADRRLEGYLRAYNGPISTAALSEVEWKALSPHEIDLTAKGLVLWATLNFFKSPPGAAVAIKGAVAAAGGEDDAAGERLRKMGTPKPKAAVQKKRHEDAVRAYNGWYYGNY